MVRSMANFNCCLIMNRRKEFVSAIQSTVRVEHEMTGLKASYMNDEDELLAE